MYDMDRIHALLAGSAGASTLQDDELTDVFEDYGPEEQQTGSELVVPAAFPGGLNENRNDGMDSLYRRIMGLQREDYAVPANLLQTELDGKAIRFVAGSSSWNATEHAVDQLSDRLSKGLRSFGSELTERGYDDLRVQILNDMLVRADAGQKFQIRTMRPNGNRLARAVVSDAFKPIDDCLIVTPMLELVSQKSGEWKALGGQLTDTHTRIRFIHREPSIRGIGPNKRDWFIGFEYRNSEVGCSRTVFNLFVYDGFCENGAVFGMKSLCNVDFVHRGIRISTDFGLITDERMQQAELAAVQGAITDATTAVLREDFSKRVIEFVERGQARRLPGGDRPELIRQIGQSIGLNRKESEHVLMHWDSREDSAFGISSAITRLAQDAKNYESRVRLEEAGGKLLEIDERKWNSILALVS